jgi:phosphoserine phosphatase
MSARPPLYASDAMDKTICLIGDGAYGVARELAGAFGASAVDLDGAAEVTGRALPDRLEALDLPEGLDAAVIPPGPRRKRLLLADMDSTVIGQECLDELARHTGHSDEIAAITEKAMRGELDFEAALEARVTLLEGLVEEAIRRVLDEVITLDPGARILTDTMRSWGASCVLVSGGFTAFTAPVAAAAGFDEHYGNTLEIESGRLKGRVRLPILGREAKQERLTEALRQRRLSPEDAICVGDGANDLGMLCAVPLGVAYKAKPMVAAAAPVKILNGDLSRLLYLQGVPRREWKE